MSDFVPVLAVFCIFGLPVIAFIINRAMHHRERIELIRRGFHPLHGPNWKDVPYMAPPPPPRVHALHEDDPNRALRKGIVVTFVGLALTIGLSFIGFLTDEGHYTFGPWLLGGLIPLFVGLAQVVTAILFGATLPIAQRARFGSPPDQGTMAPPPPPSSSAPFEGSYTYRPDPNMPELGRSSPPDHR